MIGGYEKWAGKGLEFVGQFAQAPGVEEWVEQQVDSLIEKFLTKRGLPDTTDKKIIAASILNKLQVAAKSPTFGIAVQNQVSRYLPILGKLVRQHALGVLHSNRTYVIPRFAWNKRAQQEMSAVLAQSRELTNLLGDQIALDYFFKQLVIELDSAVTSLPISPFQPIELEEGWCIVGFSDKYSWAREWTGHLYLHDAKGSPLGKKFIPVTWSRVRTIGGIFELRKFRKAVPKNISNLNDLLGRLSVQQIETVASSWDEFIRKTDGAKPIALARPKSELELQGEQKELSDT